MLVNSVWLQLLHLELGFIINIKVNKQQKQINKSLQTCSKVSGKKLKFMKSHPFPCT